MTQTLKQRLRLILPIVAVGILLDQLTKVWAIYTLKGKVGTSYLFDTVRIGYAENIGAFLGLGTELPEQMRFWVFTGLVGLFLLVLFIYMLVDKEMDRLSLIALSLIFAGGFSNFFDRAINDGAVVDFLNMGIGGLRTGIFNIADVYIMIGAGLIIVGQIHLERRSKQS